MFGPIETQYNSLLRATVATADRIDKECVNVHSRDSFNPLRQMSHCSDIVCNSVSDRIL